MKRVLSMCLAFALAQAFSTPSFAQDGVQMYECVAQKRLAGREDPSPDSPQARIAVTGELRYLERGDPGYAGVSKGKPLPEWLELFGALAGHGSSFLGFYKSTDFKCEKVER